MQGPNRKRFMVARVNTLDHYTLDHYTNQTTDGGEQSREETATEGRLRKSSLKTTFQDSFGEEDEDNEKSTYQTANQKTWATSRYLTKEVLPRLDNYRNLQSIVGRSASSAMRPTLEDLHNPGADEKWSEERKKSDDLQMGEAPISTKFGWIKGVFVRCLLNIWGVMLFLRLSWLTGQAGILEGLVIVLSGNLVTTITALSMSAISTNGQIKGGGTYYMISRSLGPEFGGAIGLIFSFANAVAASMYIVGFCESLLSLLSSYELKMIDSGINDTRIIGSGTLVFLFVICIFGGLAWESRAQIVLLFILVVAMVDFVIGVLIGPLYQEERAKGFVGIHYSVFKDNLISDYRKTGTKQESLFTVFAVFFPACTGILAGANISGDLKDPSSAIPKGTLLAILVTCSSYVLLIMLMGAAVVRDATGNVTDVENFTDFSACVNEPCQYGLQNSFQVMELVSAFGPLIYAGCFAATLSSALASLVSAPKVFQALCKDELFPFIKPFGAGYGKDDEPYKAYALTFVLALGFILIGDLNSIASIISNFFLAAYALINFSCFHTSFQKCPGWRPTFKYYNMWLSLLGAVLCALVMLLIDWWTAVLTAAIIFILYLLVAYRKPNINWGSSVQSQTYRMALSAVYSLDKVGEHVKTYRPQILLLGGTPSHRPPLVYFANTITKNTSLLVVAEWPSKKLTYRERLEKQIEAHDWLKREKIKSFYVLSDISSGDSAARSLMTTVGLGKLKPNILMLGFMSRWKTALPNELKTYLNIIHSALDLHLSICILRMPKNVDYSRIKESEMAPKEEPKIVRESPIDHDGDHHTIKEEEFEIPSTVASGLQRLTKGLTVNCKEKSASSLNLCADDDPEEPKSPMKNGASNLYPKSQSQSVSNLSLNHLHATGDLEGGSSVYSSFYSLTDGGPKNLTNGHDHREYQSSKRNKEYIWDTGEPVPSDVIEEMFTFAKKQSEGTIDVWWLFDDGGLTLLLPYILTTRSLWANCKLRIFCLVGKRDDLASEHRRMAELLCKFRIDFSDVIMIDKIHVRPDEESFDRFNALIRNFRRKNASDLDDEDEDFYITDEDLKANQDKTRRHIRLRELLLEHSSKATLIVMTLPIPTKDGVSAPMYQAWLETLTGDLPPFLLVRGNQTSVLTFYS